MNEKDVMGNSKIREQHRYTIMNFIRRFGPVSRTGIHARTKISKSTVTRVVDELIKDGIVRESGIGESTTGRKPINIELNPSAYYCIGVNISRSNIYAALVDLSMNVIEREMFSLNEVKDVNSFQGAIVSVIRQLCQKGRIDTRKLLGIGVGVPGIVDFENGVIVDFGSVHRLMDIHLKAYLESIFGIKVFVDNNANTRVLGEYWYGYGVGYQNVVFVICGEGIGSGIIADGKILRGKNNVTGELGHMQVNIDGRRCTCGRYGCIEAYCSIGAIEDIVKEALKQGKDSLLLKQVKGDIEAVDYKAVCRCAEKGDQLCLQYLEQAACILGTGLSNLIGIVNSELVILSGDLFDTSDIFFNMVTKATKERLFSPFTHDIIFMKRRVKDNLYEIGAATMVFKSFFKD